MRDVGKKTLQQMISNITHEITLFTDIQKKQKSSVSEETLDSLLLKVQDGRNGHHVSVTECEAARQRAMERCHQEHNEVLSSPGLLFRQRNWRRTHNTKQQKSGTQPNCPPKVPRGITRSFIFIVSPFPAFYST